MEHTPRMFSGSLVALITPFRDGGVDEQCLRSLVDFHVDQGTDGVVPVGTTGESATLTPAEHKRAVEIVVEQAAGRLCVVAGAGSNNPIESLEYARHAQSAGADGALLVAGYYNRPSQEGIYQHFKFVHDGTDIPLIVYNIPSRTAVDIKPETMARLAQLERVAGVKDATRLIARITEERHLIGDDFAFLSGDDLTALAYNVAGGNGCISVTGNVVPALCSDLQRACQQGDFLRARALHDRLVPLHMALFMEPSPAGVKYAASLLGLCSEEVRLPIIALSKTSRHAVKAGLVHAGATLTA